MKKTIVLGMFLLMMLSACNTGDDASETNKDPNKPLNESEETVDEETLHTNCDGDRLVIDMVCMETEDLDDLELFKLMTDSIETRYENRRAFQSTSSMELKLYEEDYTVWKEFTLSNALQYSQFDEYYYDRFYNATWSSVNTTPATRLTERTSGVLIDTDDTKLRQFTMEDKNFTIEHKGQSSDHNDVVNAHTAIQDIVLDSTLFSSIEKQDIRTFKATAPLSLLSQITPKYERLFEENGMGELYDDTFDFEVTFLENASMELEVTSKDRTYTIDGEPLKLRMTLELEMQAGMGDMVEPMDGRWNYTLPKSKEAIEFTNDVYTLDDKDIYHLEATGGWFHFQLDPGFYEHFTQLQSTGEIGVHDDATMEYTFYDASGNVLELDNKFEVTTPVDIYMHLVPTASRAVAIHMDPLDITNLVVERDLPVNEGTITGAFEGGGDEASYLFAETAPYDGYMKIDASQIQHEDEYLLVLSYHSTYACFVPDNEYCYTPFEEGDELGFDLLGDFDGDYIFNYEYIAKEAHEKDFETMKPVTDYDEANPLYVTGEGQSTRFEVSKSNFDVALKTTLIHGTRSDFEVDLYTSTNHLIKEDWNGSYMPLGTGDYILTFTSDGANIVFLYPELLFHEQ